MARTAHTVTEGDAAVTAPTERPRLSIRDRILAWRDRLIMNPAFQAWAADFPFTRRTARRSAEQLFDVCAGFVYSQILLACVRLNLFEILKDGPQSLVEISRRLGLQTDQTRRLLTAAVSLNLVQRRSAGRFGLGQLGAAMLGNPAVANMVRHHPMFYEDMSDPVALLRGDPDQMSLSRFWLYSSTEQPADATSTDVTEYTSLMGDTQAMIATDVLDAYDLSGHHKLLDVGGGNGAFLAAAAAKSAALQLMLFDLPAVAKQAEANLARMDLAGRSRTFGGDAFAD
ncbi:MAG: methyltransferase, partial [Pseudomonadota bacterium]